MRGAAAWALGIWSAASLLIAQTPQPSIAGTWTLNTYLSDNPEQVARELLADTGQSADATLFGGDLGGGGGFGTRRGMGRGYGGRASPSDRAREERISPQDQGLLEQVTRTVQN